MQRPLISIYKLFEYVGIEENLIESINRINSSIEEHVERKLKYVEVIVDYLNLTLVCMVWKAIAAIWL